MAESNSRLSLHIPWSTLLKVILAVALVIVFLRIFYILTLILIAIIVAIGLYPAVIWLERRGASRTAASFTVVFALLAVIVCFLAVTWSAIVGQSQDVFQHLEQTSADLARFLRVSEANIRVIRHRAIHQLRECMGVAA